MDHQHLKLQPQRQLLDLLGRLQEVFLEGLNLQEVYFHRAQHLSQHLEAVQEEGLGHQGHLLEAAPHLDKRLQDSEQLPQHLPLEGLEQDQRLDLQELQEVDYLEQAVVLQEDFLDNRNLEQHNLQLHSQHLLLSK